MKYSLILLLYFGCLSNNLIAQKERQLTFTAGKAYSTLNDQLWGYQTYKGWNTNYELGYGWAKPKSSHQFRLSFAEGNIAIPNALRRRTIDLHFSLNYQHLRLIKVLGKSKINWSTGAGLATFLDLRLHDQFSSNNTASYNLGVGLQWQNLFRRTFIRKNNRPIECSFLVETTLLSALMVPDYANTNPQKSLEINGLNDLSLGEIIERMQIVSIPKFWRANMHTIIDFVETQKFGLRVQYIWSMVHGKQRLQFTGVRHQVLGGCFIRF